MALLQLSGNDGQATGSLSLRSGSDASLAVPTSSSGYGCGPGIAELAIAAMAANGLVAGLGSWRAAALGCC